MLKNAQAYTFERKEQLMRKPVVAVLGALSIFAATAQAAAQGAGQDAFLSAIKAMKRSVAPLMCFRSIAAQSNALQPPAQAGGAQQKAPLPPPPREWQPIVDASAFFISRRGDFITAAHAVADFQPGRPLAGCAMSIWFESQIDAAGNYSAQAFFVSASQCISDAGLDVARCRTIDDLSRILDGRFTPDPVNFDTEQRDDGSPVAVTGFPLFTTAPITARGYIGGYMPPANGAPRMVMDRAAWPGGSGSPVYDSRVRVLGMVIQAGEGLASGISVACTSDAIEKFLSAHPVDTR